MNIATKCLLATSVILIDQLSFEKLPTAGDGKNTDTQVAIMQRVRDLLALCSKCDVYVKSIPTQFSKLCGREGRQILKAVWDKSQ